MKLRMGCWPGGKAPKLRGPQQPPFLDPMTSKLFFAST